MTKDEMLQAARDAGLLFNEDAGTELAHELHISNLTEFWNSAMERAAVECDALKKRYADMAQVEDEAVLDTFGNSNINSRFWGHVSALAGVAHDIRAMKIKEGD